MIPSKTDKTEIFLVTHFGEPLGYALELDLAEVAGQKYGQRRYPTYPLHWKPSSNGVLKLFLTRNKLAYWTGVEIKVLKRL